MMVAVGEQGFFFVPEAVDVGNSQVMPNVVGPVGVAVVLIGGHGMSAAGDALELGSVGEPDADESEPEPEAEPAAGFVLTHDSGLKSDWEVPATAMMR